LPEAQIHPHKLTAIKPHSALLFIPAAQLVTSLLPFIRVERRVNLVVYIMYVRMYACTYVIYAQLESIVGERVSALRKLKTNPHDKEALGTIFNIQQQVSGIARMGLRLAFSRPRLRPRFYFVLELSHCHGTEW